MLVSVAAQQRTLKVMSLLRAAVSCNHKWQHPGGYSSRLRNDPTTTKYSNCAEIKREHPLDLSISFSGGKENNSDPVSSGE